MCVTCHFIDSDWNLYKKIISFVPINSHRGEYIAKCLENALLDWGVKSVFSITVDNASYNDIVVGYVKKKLVSWGASTVRCKFLHMRCIAHILNLVVNDGLKEANRAVKKVRECVRFIRSSPAYLRKFKELSELDEIDYKSSLVLDIAIRWNSTYLMLKTAC